MERHLKGSMGVTDFAMLYFPDSTPKTAYNTMRRWIVMAPGLLDRLKSVGYRPFGKYYTPKQVEVLVEHFGEP